MDFRGFFDYINRGRILRHIILLCRKMSPISPEAEDGSVRGLSAR